MAALEPSEDTLLILTSDHGNGLTGKGAAYEGGVRVPLIMRWPRHADRAAGSDLRIQPLARTRTRTRTLSPTLTLILTLTLTLTLTR